MPVIRQQGPGPQQVYDWNDREVIRGAVHDALKLLMREGRGFIAGSSGETSVEFDPAKAVGRRLEVARAFEQKYGVGPYQGHYFNLALQAMSDDSKRALLADEILTPTSRKVYDILQERVETHRRNPDALPQANAEQLRFLAGDNEVALEPINLKAIAVDPKAREEARDLRDAFLQEAFPTQTKTLQDAKINIGFYDLIYRDRSIKDPKNKGWDILHEQLKGAREYCDKKDLGNALDVVDRALLSVTGDDRLQLTLAASAIHREIKRVQT